MSPKARHTPAAGHILSAQIHAFPWDSPLGGDTADCCWLLHPCPFPLRPGRQLLTTRLRSRIHLLDGGFGGEGRTGCPGYTKGSHLALCTHILSSHPCRKALLPPLSSVPGGRETEARELGEQRTRLGLKATSSILLTAPARASLWSRDSSRDGEPGQRCASG